MAAISCDHSCHKPTDTVWTGHCVGCEPLDDLEYAVRMELIALWDDMDVARRTRIAFVGGRESTDEWWSIHMENVATRIQHLSYFVGAVPWQCVQTRLLRAGIYDEVYKDFDYEPVDWAEVQRYEDLRRDMSQGV